MNQYLTSDNFWRRYTKSKSWTESWTKNFKEYARISRNEAPNTVPENYANISDGSTAALIRKTPKRVIQQMPTGIVTTDNDNDWLPIVAEFILLNKIIPLANLDYDLIQKFWSIVENGEIFGGQAVYTPFVQENGEFTADASLVYWGDIMFQEGKKSFYSCDYFFIRSWWQPETIDAIIDQDKKMAKLAKERGEKYESTWDIKALKKAKHQITEKTGTAVTASEEENSVEASGIEIIVGFQKGVGAEFITACPMGDGGGLILRRKRNKDPRGLPPVDYFYADVDGSNPFGRSMIELVGGLQNMIDGNMRAYMFNRALSLAPPLQVYGNVDTTQAMYEADAIIEMGDDPNNRIVPLSVDTTALREYANIYNLNKSQLLNLYNSGGDTTIASDVGNPTFGKTPAALKQQQAVMSADDNYLRKNFESFFENWAETAINVYFAEHEGKEELQLDNKTANRLRKLNDLPEGFISDDNKIIIDYSSATPALHFRVDASTSKLNGQSEQLEALQLLTEMASTPTFAQIVPKEAIASAWNKIVANSGVEDPEDLEVNLEDYQAAETETLTAENPTPEMANSAEQQLVTQPTPQNDQIRTLPGQNDLYSNNLSGQTPPSEDVEIVKLLRGYQIPDRAIVEVLKAKKNGASKEEIVEFVRRLMQ